MKMLSLYNDINVLIDLLYTVNTTTELLPRLATKRLILHIHRALGDVKGGFRTHLIFVDHVVYRPLLVISPKHNIVMNTGITSN